MDCSQCMHDFESIVLFRNKIGKKQTNGFKGTCCRPISTTQEPFITTKRLDNFLKSFTAFTWDLKSLELTVIGYGDRPAFQIDGLLQVHGADDMKVRWHSNTPGGGQARLYYWIKDKRCRVNAPQKDAKKVSETAIHNYYRGLAALEKVTDI